MSEPVKATVRLFNYRCFGGQNPGLIELRPGFTALVGPNNAGKSTLLRALRELRPLFLVPLDRDQFRSFLRGDPRGYGLSEVEDLLEIAHDRVDAPTILEIAIQPTSALDLNRIRFVFDRKEQTWRGEFYCDHGRRRLQVEDASPDGFLFDMGGGNKAAGSMEAIRQFAGLVQSAIYVPAFRHAISGATGTIAGDLLVGTEFLNKWADWQTGSIKAHRQLINRVIEDIRKLFEFDELRVQPAVGNTTLQIFINGKDYRLRELGAGLTQFLLVLATAAIKRPSLVLIDEPELNLHPSLQQDFLTALGSYCDYGVIFATHSIGLARTSALHVYSVQSGKDGSEVRPWESTVGIAELLGELGYASYRETGLANILGVEGVEDVRPAQQLLRLLGIEHSTLVIPLGGDRVLSERGVSLVHELLRVGSKVAILLDSERETEGGPAADRRDWFVAECRKVGVQVHLTQRRALENYLTDAALKSVFGPKTAALSAFQPLKAASHPWAKRENWRVFREMQLQDLRGTDLLKFLEGLRSCEQHNAP